VGNRDLILIDQRGTGYSQPSLDCPAAAHLIQVPPQPVGKELASLDSAYRQCHDRLVHDGIDLSAYNTVDNAADIADLRKALGYRTVNLYGVSYGTRLALTVMRHYPQGIRSLVLDSVLPPQHDYAALLRSIDTAFTTLFHSCAQAPNCSHEFPHLQQVAQHQVRERDTTQGVSWLPCSSCPAVASPA
jgi:pimeloyl-ACP methyl ester carboxylesterase